MRVAVSSALCDALEVGAMQLGVPFAIEDVIKELTQGMPDADARTLVEEALKVSVQRAKCCPDGYPFESTPRIVRPKVGTGDWNLYLFLLFGCTAMHGGVLSASDLVRRFRKHFEDVVCWSLRRGGLTAEVLSQPRRERGLPTSLKPALREVAKRFGEYGCELKAQKVTSDDNDLGVDVIATSPRHDAQRGGRPIFLFQCATGPVDELYAKMAEDYALFPAVWDWGFHANASIRGGASPYDLLTLERVNWDRLCGQGWVLDRMRLVELAHASTTPQNPVGGTLNLWNEFANELKGFDWRNSWQYAL
jgi:hypothetical protein